MNKPEKLFRLATKPAYLRAMFHGTAAAIEHEKPLAGRQFDTVVDIGANRAQFTVFARATWPFATIIAFEPIKEAYMRLFRVVGQDPNISCFQEAIGPERKAVMMNVAEKNDSSSLLQIGRAQTKLYGTKRERFEEVQIAPLDYRIDPEVITGRALLKIDVQGFEMEALKGCEALLDRFRVVYVECSAVELYEGQAFDHEVVAWLYEHGFTLERWAQQGDVEPRSYGCVDYGCAHNPRYDELGRFVQGDFLFERMG